MNPSNSPRRRFLRNAVALSTGITSISIFPQSAYAEQLADERNVIGPKAGYSPQIGTLVSMLDWMRSVILSPVKGMTIEQLDYLHDEKSNSIGAMLLHLAATEKYYHLHTFNGMKWGTWDESVKKEWDVPMRLGEPARKEIKGKPLSFYLDRLEETRAASLAEFKKRDDRWLMAVDKDWPWGPTNNYCKWFHVCEHESNHNGQIKWIKSRLPGAKGSGD